MRRTALWQTLADQARDRVKTRVLGLVKIQIAFERALFRTAIALAALLILVRVGAMLLLAFLPLWQIDTEPVLQ